MTQPVPPPLNRKDAELLKRHAGAMRLIHTLEPGLTRRERADILLAVVAPSRQLRREMERLAS